MLYAQHSFAKFKSNLPYRIYMTQTSDDDGGGAQNQSFPPPAEQFRPLQSVFRRRLLTGVSAASALAAGANFGGVTSFILGFSPDAARSLKLDALYPVGGYSRYIDADQGFEFVYPESWLGDQRLLYRAAGRAERSLDPPSLAPQRRKAVNEPVVAFGPAGSSGELNVSVIVAAVPAGFSIEKFGGAEEVGEAVVRTITGGGKRTDVMGRLMGWRVREDGEKKVKYYEIEYGVEGRDFRRRNVAVCCARGGRLYTLNAQAPESVWPEFEKHFYTIAHSFALV